MPAEVEWMGWCRFAGLLGIFVMVGCSTPSGEEPGGGSQAGRSGVPQEAVVPKPEVKERESSVKAGAITEVDLQRLLELQDGGKVLLVDVRPSLFYAMGHIPEAVSLPKKRYAAEYPKKKSALDEALAAGRVIVLYCTNVECPDGYSVAKLLSAEGYSVSLYKGGWEEWKAMGFE